MVPVTTNQLFYHMISSLNLYIKRLIVPRNQGALSERSCSLSTRTFRADCMLNQLFSASVPKGCSCRSSYLVPRRFQGFQATFCVFRNG